MTRPAPLTTAALGSTRCVGCEKRFAETPDLPITETEGQVENRGHIDSVGSRHRGIGTHAETRRWHVACLDDFEARNAQYRARVRRDQLELVVSMCEANGIEIPAEVAAELATLS